MIVTTFKDLYTQQPNHVSVEKVLEAIRAGKQKDLLEQIKNTKDPEERNNLKRRLPVIMFSGRFSSQKIEGLIEYSKLICLDYDHIDNLKEKMHEVRKIPYTYATWISPSGEGIKVLVKVATDNHKGHFAALIKEYQGCDESTKDVSRRTFISYDPEIWINPRSDVFAKFVEVARNDQSKYDNLKKWLENKGEKFKPGNRNNFIASLAGACNRFGIDKGFCEEVIQKDFVNGNDFSIREMQSVIDKIYTNYADQHNTASFEESFSDRRVNEILDAKVETHDIIYLNDVRDDLLHDFDHGTQKAPTTYFPSIDEMFRPMRGDLNVLTGIGNYGKSALQKQMDLVRAVKNGEKFGYHSREEYPPMFWYRELIRSLVGKPLERDSPNRMSREEYSRAMEFVREHFVYIYPPKLPTPEYIIERFVEAIIKHSLTGCTVDPWNQLLHVMDKRDDIYLGETLTEFEMFAQQQNVYMTIIAHPNRTKKKDDGNYEAPDVYDLNGGPVWNARATNITCYHRPFYQTDKQDSTCEFFSRKIKKQMLSGIPGTAVLNYRRETGRFYDNGYSPLDDFKL